MAASSPYSGNDYQALSNFRPYELPINDIFKSLSAQNEFWEIGARRVNAAYNNALNLDLTLDANKEVKKKYMEDAEKQLTRLSSMDLSDPSIQRQGFNIYRPLLKDEAIMYDSELTKVRKGIYGDANMYRRKKLSSTGVEGEGYTDRNLAYSLDGFEVFNEDTPRDPNMLKEMYGKLGQRKFAPYYNPTQEYASILKNCKGSATEKQDVASNYMYFDNFSKSGANSSETSNCFMMGLSEKAKAQMGIDGWAYYKSNPQLLVDDHRTFALGEQERQLKGVQGKIEGIKAGGVSAAEQAQLKELEDLLPALQRELDNRTTEYNEMVGGNAMNYVMQNFQTLSKGIYLGKNYKALGEAFKSDETSRKLTANAAGIAQYNAIERSMLAERQNEWDKENIVLRAQLTRKLKQEAGEIPLDMVNPLTPPVTGDTDTGQSYGEQDFKNEKETAFKAYSDSYNSLAAYMFEKNPNIRKMDANDAYIINFANEQSKKPIEQQDKQFLELMEVYNKTKENFANMDMRQKAVNKIVENEMLKDKTIKPISIGGVNLTLNEMGRIKRGEVIKGVKFNPMVEQYGEAGNVVDSEPHFTVNGKGRFHDDSYEQTISNMSKRRDELYRKAYYDAKNYLSPRINPEKMPSVDNQIKNILGVIGGNNEKGGYKLIGHDRTGKDLLVVALDGDGNEVKADFQRARSLNVNVTQEKIGTSVNAIRIPNILPELADVPSPDQQNNINNLRNFYTLMDSELKSKGAYASSENLKNSDGTTFPYSNFTFKTPRGTDIRVKAVQSNGQTKLVPAVQITKGDRKGEWDTNFQSFATPEELVLYFRIY
jgi:hypothetical protein